MKNKGFTLLELMVVIAISSILMWAMASWFKIQVSLAKKLNTTVLEGGIKRDNPKTATLKILNHCAKDVNCDGTPQLCLTTGSKSTALVCHEDTPCSFDEELSEWRRGDNHSSWASCSSGVFILQQITVEIK